MAAFEPPLCTSGRRLQVAVAFERPSLRAGSSATFLSRCQVSTGRLHLAAIVPSSFDQPPAHPAMMTWHQFTSAGLADASVTCYRGLVPSREALQATSCRRAWSASHPLRAARTTPEQLRVNPAIESPLLGAAIEPASSLTA